MSMVLTILTEEYKAAFKADMKAAFRYGAFVGMGMDADVLPENNINESPVNTVRRRHYGRSLFRTE